MQIFLPPKILATFSIPTTVPRIVLPTPIPNLPYCPLQTSAAPPTTIAAAIAHSGVTIPPAPDFAVAEAEGLIVEDITELDTDDDARLEALVIFK